MLEKNKNKSIKTRKLFKIERISGIDDDFIYPDVHAKNLIEPYNHLEIEDLDNISNMIIHLIKIGMFVEKRILKWNSIDDFMMFDIGYNKPSVEWIPSPTLNMEQIKKDDDLYNKLINMIIDFNIKYGSQKKAISIEGFIYESLMIALYFYRYKNKYNNNTIPKTHFVVRFKSEIILTNAFEFEEHTDEKSNDFDVVYELPTLIDFIKYQIYISLQNRNTIRDVLRKIDFCKYCHTPFLNSSGKQLFCNVEHTRKYHANKDKKGNIIKTIEFDNDNVPDNRICELDSCYNLIDSVRSTKRFCSESCSRKAKRLEKKTTE